MRKIKGEHYHFYNYFTSFLSKQVNTLQFPQLNLHLLQSPWIFSKFKSKSSDAARCCILCNQYGSFKGQRTCSRILKAITHRPQNSTIALECTSVCCRSAKRKALLSAVVKCYCFFLSHTCYTISCAFKSDKRRICDYLKPSLEHLGLRLPFSTKKFDLGQPIPQPQPHQYCIFAETYINPQEPERKFECYFYFN